MIMITGHSQKSDGICFLANTDDHAVALNMMCDAWNAQFSDKVKLASTDENDYLLHESYSVGDLADECPRYEGFLLYKYEVQENKINQSMPW